jgi:RHS repeat-associated protein
MIRLDEMLHVITIDLDAKAVTYRCDNQGRPSQVKLGATTLLAFTYNLDDSIAAKSECNDNSTVAYTYNYRGWVSTIKAKDKAGAVFLDMTYTYDAVGNVKSIANAVGAAGTETYTYDRLDRLTKAVAPSTWGTYQYGYNAVGDRAWASEVNNRTYSYYAYSKLKSDGAWHYDNDSNGNVIWKNSTSVNWKYVYNSFGQMTQVLNRTYSGGAWSPLTIVATYYYDAAGARARTVEGNATTIFVYAGHDALLQIGADGKCVKYVYAGGLQLRVVAVGETYSYVADALGSTRFVLKNGNKDAANILYSAVTYKPFGGAVTSSGGDRITFAGEAQDGTGLVYLSARYYDPAIGRFYALDPELGRISMPQTLDRYVYCVNNPLAFTDPSGRDIFGDVGNWFSENGATIAVVVVCVALTIATAGIASPALALAASMAIGAGTSALDYGLKAGSSFSWDGMAASMGMGAALGAIGFGAGAAISRGAASVAVRSIDGALQSRSIELSVGGRLARAIGGIDKESVGKLLTDDVLPGEKVGLRAGTNWVKKITCRFQTSPEAKVGFFRSDNCAIRGAFGKYSDHNTAETLAWEYMKPGRYLYYDVGENRAIVCNPNRVSQFLFYSRGA